MGRRFVAKNPHGPPGRSQINFAQQLGIEIPPGITRGELDVLIEKRLVATVADPEGQEDQEPN